MILYHGTNIRIEQIDLKRCAPFKDFGQGFYLTDLEHQAQNMAERIADMRGGIPLVHKYLFDETYLTSNTFKVKIFDAPSEEWASFVMANRDRKVTHPVHQYDIVVGPVANDVMATQFRIFSDGYINLKELARRLEYKDYTKQLFFATPAAIELLKPL